MESEVTSKSQSSAVFMVLDSQDDNQCVHPNKIFDTLTALKGVPNEPKERSPLFSPRSCELPTSGASAPKKAAGGEGEGDGGGESGNNPPPDNPPEGGGHGGGGQGGSGAGGDGGTGGGAGGGGSQGGDDPEDNEEQEGEAQEEDDEAAEETPSSGNSGNSVPALVRPDEEPVPGGDGYEFAVPRAPGERDADDQPGMSESEGGISDAPTAVVSDTEGHGQVFENVKPAPGTSNVTSSPDLHQVSSTSNDSPKAGEEISSAVSTMSSLNTSSSEETFENTPQPPKKRILLKRPKPSTSAQTSTSESEPVTSSDASDGKKSADTSGNSSKDQSDLNITASQTDLFDEEDPHVTREEIPAEKEETNDNAAEDDKLTEQKSPNANVVPETFDEESLNMIPPTLDAFESVPSVVPSSQDEPDPPTEAAAESSKADSVKSPGKDNSEGKEKSAEDSKATTSSRPSSRLQEWQPSCPTEESSESIEKTVSRQEDYPSKTSESLNLRLSGFTEKEPEEDSFDTKSLPAHVASNKAVKADLTSKPSSDLPKPAPTEPDASKSVPEGGDQKPEASEKPDISIPKDDDPDLSEESAVLIDTSSDKSAKEQPKDLDSSQDLSLHYTQTQAEPSQFTIGLDTEAGKDKTNDDKESISDDEVLLLEPMDLPKKGPEKDVSAKVAVNPQEVKSTKPEDKSDEKESEAITPAKPSLSLDMIDTEETQDPNTIVPGPVFRIDRPSVDSEIVDELSKKKEVSVFQRVDETIGKQQEKKKQESSSSSNGDPFEFSQGRQLMEQVAFCVKKADKEKKLLEKRKASPLKSKPIPVKTPIQEVHGEEEDSNKIAVKEKEDTNKMEVAGEDGDTNKTKAADKDKETRKVEESEKRNDDGTELMEVDEEEVAEPKECPMSAKPASEGVLGEETEEAAIPAIETPAKNTAEKEKEAEHKEPEKVPEDSQTQEYIVSPKEKSPSVPQESRKSLDALVKVLTKAKQEEAERVKSPTEKDTQIISEIPAATEEKNAPVLDIPVPTEAAVASVPKATGSAAKKGTPKSRKRVRRTPARPVPEATSESSPPQERPAATARTSQPKEKDIFDYSDSQSQREKEEFERVKRLTEQARRRKATLELKDICSHEHGLAADGQGTASKSSVPSSAAVSNAEMPAPSAIPSPSVATPQRQSRIAPSGVVKTYKIVTVKSTYEHVQTFVEEIVDGKTTEYRLDAQKWDLVKHNVDVTLDTLDPSPSRRASGSLTSGDLADVSSISRSSSNRTSMLSFGSDRLSVGTVGSRRSSKSSGSLPPVVIGEVRELPEPEGIPLDRRLSNISTLAARESIESPRRSHMTLCTDDQSESMFSEGILKRSSLAQGIDVTGQPVLPAAGGHPRRHGTERGERATRTSLRSRGAPPLPLFPTDLTGLDMGTAGTSRSTLTEASSLMGPDLVPPTAMQATVSETSIFSVPETSPNNTTDWRAGGKQAKRGLKRANSRSRQESEESLVPDTDVEKPALSMPVDGTPKSPPKKKGKARRKSTTPKKKIHEQSGESESKSPKADVSKSPGTSKEPPAVSGADNNVKAKLSSPSKTKPAAISFVDDQQGSVVTDLNLTPPHTPTQTLDVGTRVMAMWKDKHYYSGQIKACMKSGTYKVAFDDGNTKNNSNNTIIVCRLLPVGHWVMAEKEDWQESALIKGHYKDGETYGYIVEFESGQEMRLAQSSVSLDGEQAQAVLEHPVPLIAEPPQESGKSKTPTSSPVKGELSKDEALALSQEIAPLPAPLKHDKKRDKNPEGEAEPSVQKPGRVTPNRTPKTAAASPYNPNIKPHLHKPGIILEPSTPVMALWTDKHYYPGTVVKQDTIGRYEVLFEDGDVRHVTESEIIVCELLDIGQSVYAESGGEYMSAMVMDHYKRGPEIGYVVEFDEGNRENVPRAKVTINLDQANALFGNSAGPICTPIGAKAFDISLDNLVAGKRRRGADSTSTPQPMSESPSVTQASKPSTSGSSTVKKATTGTKKSAPSEGDVTVSTKTEDPPPAPETSTAKKKATKGKKGSTASKRKEPPNTKGKGAKRKGSTKAETQPVDELKTPVSKKRKAEEPEPKPETSPETPKSKRRLISQDSPEQGRDQDPKFLSQTPPVKQVDEKDLKGPMPPSGSRIFAGMSFILTHADKSGELMRQERRLIMQSPIYDNSTDESSMEEEPLVPFDKFHIRAQIEAGGGTIIEDLSKLDTITGQCFLISNSCQRTVKYLVSLAAGFHCISHIWIRDSCKMGKLLDHSSYTLPAGFDCDYSRAVEWNAEHRPLQELKTFISSENASFVQNWTLILKTAGCDILSKMPTKASTQAGKCQVDLVVGDPTVRPAVISQAASQGVPVVSSEWVIQCLIHGHRLPFLSNPKFKHDAVM